MKRYAKIIAKSGVEYKDIYQEAMLGFADALDKYNDTKEAQLPTFITLCVKRRLSNLLRGATNVKSKFNKDILSFTLPQQEQVFVEGNHLSATINFMLFHLHLYSNCLRIS